MKIYKNKTGHITIIYSKNEVPAGVSLVHDRGSEKMTNIFGSKINRYAYHNANIWNNTPHTTCTDNYKLEDNDKRYKLIRSKQK